MITRSFKTAQTDSLLLISNLLPLDCRVVEIAAHRLLSRNIEAVFAQSSKETLTKMLPFLNSSHRIEPLCIPRPKNYPPWAIRTNAVVTSPVFVPLLPSVSTTLTLFAHCFRKRNTAGIGVVATDIEGVQKIMNIPLSPLASYRQAQSILLSKVLLVTNELSLRYKTFEIFLSDRYFPYHPGSTLTPTETTNFSNLISLGPSAQVFLATNPSSPGVLLARHWAKAPSIGMIPQLLSPRHIKILIRSKLNEGWNREWIASGTGNWSFFRTSSPLEPS